MKTLPFQECSGRFFSELSSRIWTYKAILYFILHSLIAIGLCAWRSLWEVLPRSVPLAHFHFASVSHIWLFLLVLITEGMFCVACGAVLCMAQSALQSHQTQSLMESYSEVLRKRPVLELLFLWYGVFFALGTSSCLEP